MQSVWVNDGFHSSNSVFGWNECGCFAYSHVDTGEHTIY